MSGSSKEAALKVGSLTVISTHALIDTKGWKITEAKDLVKQAAKILQD